MTRRQFGLIIISLSLPTSVYSNTHELLRPPGCVDEKTFLSRCNRCQKCVQVCPTKVIFPASFAYGVVKANTPVLSFKNSFCNSCMKCTHVCPTKALIPTTQDDVDIGVAVIVQHDCVAWDWVGCRVCVDKCPLKAIYLDDSGRPVVTPELCNGCGICQMECPSTSLRTSKKGKGVIVKNRDINTPPRNVGVINEQN